MRVLIACSLFVWASAIWGGRRATSVKAPYGVESPFESLVSLNGQHGKGTCTAVLNVCTQDHLRGKFNANTRIIRDSRTARSKFRNMAVNIRTNRDFPGVPCVIRACHTNTNLFLLLSLRHATEVGALACSNASFRFATRE